jgi:hypothetical protein
MESGERFTKVSASSTLQGSHQDHAIGCSRERGGWFGEDRRSSQQHQIDVLVQRSNQLC